MDGCILRVEKLANGYEVEILDPKIQEENKKPKSEWKSPWVGYAFTSAEEVKTFVGLHLDNLKPEPSDDDQYGMEFARQAAKMDESE
ncbi:MAG: hypothetical protein ACYC36_02390 [Bellilinea sp.]